MTGTTAVHICFGYAAVIHVRPSGYSFLPEFANSPVKQVSIETAQSGLDCAVLEKLSGKTIILGTLDLSDMGIETAETVAARIRRALPHVPAERIVVAPDCGLKYLPRAVAFGKMIGQRFPRNAEADARVAVIAPKDDAVVGVARCPFVEPACRAAPPPLVEVAPGHLTRCRRAPLAQVLQ